MQKQDMRHCPTNELATLVDEIPDRTLHFNGITDLPRLRQEKAGPRSVQTKVVVIAATSRLRCLSGLILTALSSFAVGQTGVDGGVAVASIRVGS